MIVRDEERDIAEWLAFQFAVGFDTCFVYDNGSIDGTPRIIRGFGRKFDVRLVDWPARESMAQHHAYRHCLTTTREGFDWVAFIDSDEMIVPRQGDIKALLARHGAASAVLVNWALFGSSGHQTRPPGLMVETFTRRAHDDFAYNRLVKSIVRPQETGWVESPHHFEVRGRSSTAAGHPPEWQAPGRTTTVDLSVAQVNHYFTRSRAEWGWKQDRGYWGPQRGMRLSHEFKEFDRNEIEDRGVLRFATAIRAVLDAVGLGQNRGAAA